MSLGGAQTVRKEIGAFAVPDAVHWAPGLPKTRSGKILRGTMKKIADQDSWAMPATIDDPVVLDEIKGEQPCGFIVLKSGVDRPHAEIEREVVALVRDKIGPVAAFKLALVVARLPKTRSGKILRGTMKKIADHDPWSTPATIEDPAVLEEIAAALKARGF